MQSSLFQNCRSYCLSVTITSLCQHTQIHGSLKILSNLTVAKILLQSRVRKFHRYIQLSCATCRRRKLGPPNQEHLVPSPGAFVQPEFLPHQLTQAQANNPGSTQDKQSPYSLPTYSFQNSHNILELMYATFSFSQSHTGQKEAKNRDWYGHITFLQVQHN